MSLPCRMIFPKIRIFPFPNDTTDQMHKRRGALSECLSMISINFEMSFQRTSLEVLLDMSISFQPNTP